MKDLAYLTKFPDLNNSDYVAMEREFCSRSMANFTKRAWRVLEPQAELKWGWALDAVCDHLEAVSRGEILRLLINVPPGCMKSLLAGVMLPAYEWGPRKLQGMRYLGTSHKEPLAVRDNVKCRRLIESEWYQKLWTVEMTSDQNSKMKFENSNLGFREAMAFGSMTGSRGDRVILDDPLSVDDAKSDAELKSARDTFKEALPTRVNDPERSAIIAIMQRLHTLDVAGVILADHKEYVHLMLPMEFESERRCITVLGTVDKRTTEGELLFPSRFSAEYVEREKKGMGQYAVAGQFQQRPAPRGGGLFKEKWFQYIDASELPARRKTVRGWDLAGSVRKDSPWTAGAKVSVDIAKNIYIENMVRFKKTPGPTETMIKKTATSDGRKVPGSFPQDPGQAGKSQALKMRNVMKPYNYSSSPETGSKVQRADPVATDAELGMVYIVRGPWNQDFIDEATLFPFGPFADQVDALSRAYEYLQTSKFYTLDNL